MLYCGRRKQEADRRKVKFLYTLNSTVETKQWLLLSTEIPDVTASAYGERSIFRGDGVLPFTRNHRKYVGFETLTPL